MKINNFQTKKIEELKEELITNYITLMSLVLFVYFVICVFFIVNKWMAYYYGVGLFLLYIFFILRKKYHMNYWVGFYFIIVPIYNFFDVIAYWEYSNASIAWFIPLPLGVYIFFDGKKAIYYSFYILILILLLYFFDYSHNKNIFEFLHQHYNKKEIIFLDMLIYIFDIMVISLLIYYKDKIIKQEVLLSINKIDKVVSSLDDKETERYEILFEKIEDMMKEKMYFKDKDFNISILCTTLKINSGYVSKAIRYKGYINFNHYLNFYRVNYVKKLLSEINLKKVTLLYIYTEAGFPSQSTFNRVFKQMEGITPSEYIKNLD